MAGSDPRFPYAQFREAILFAMQMATPNTVEERVTFLWNTEHTFARADVSGKPYIWGDTPTSTVAHAPVQVDCVVEIQARQSMDEQTSVGEFNPARATVYLMKDEYDQIQGADQVTIGGNSYNIKSVGYAISLFEFDMYPIYTEAVDES